MGLTLNRNMNIAHMSLEGGFKAIHLLNAAASFDSVQISPDFFTLNIVDQDITFGDNMFA